MSIRDLFAAEARKMWSLRSLMLTATIAVTLMLIYCLLDSDGTVKITLAEPGAVDSAGIGQHVFVNLAFLPILVAAPIAASEYTGGQITTSVLAAPRRGRLLTAKLLLTSIVGAALGLLLAVMVIVFYQGRLAEHSVFTDGTAATYLGSLALAVGYWMVLGVLTVCAAILVRSQTVVLAVMILLTFMSFVLLLVSPAFQYLPTIAGQTIFIPAEQLNDLPAPPSLGQPTAIGVTLGWAIAAIVITTAAFLRRDIGARQATTV